MGIDRVIYTPTMTIDQSRYEELIKAELKAEQYKKELQRLGEYEYLINIVEATYVENENESEEN